MKYWLDHNQLIVITDANILFGTYTRPTLSQYIEELKAGKIPAGLVGVPIRYVKQIEYSPQNETLILLLKNDKQEEIEFSDAQTGAAVFNFIQLHFSSFQHAKPNNKRAVKNYLMAIGGLSFFFAYLYFTDPNQALNSWRSGLVVGLARFVDQYLTFEVFYGIVAAIFMWRTLAFVRYLKVRRKTKVLRRKLNPSTH